MLQKKIVIYCACLLLLVFLNACTNEKKEINEENQITKQTGMSIGEESVFLNEQNNQIKETDREEEGNYLYTNSIDTIESLENDIYIETKTNGVYKYHVYENHIEIAEYLGEDTIVYIPEEIEERKVLEIGEYAFEAYADEDALIEKLVIPDGVLNIKQYAFKGQKELKILEIPNSVKRIENGALNETKWFEKQDREFVVVGDGVLVKYNGYEKYLIIPEGIKFISSIFWDEKYDRIIKELFVPEGVEEIDFRKCSSYIEYVTIPKSLKRINKDALVRANWYKKQKETFVIVGDGILIKVNPEEDEKILKIPDGVKYIAWDEMWTWSSKKIQKIIFPESVKGFAKSVCASFRNIEFILPSTLERIESHVFDSSMLKTIVFPKSLKKIGTATFTFNDLRTLDFSVGLLEIGESAFSFNTKLKSVNIPEGTRVIRDTAFLACESLKDVYIPESVTYIGERVFATVYDEDTKTLVVSKALTIYGKKGSVAEKYAKEHGIKFVVE